MSLSPSPDGPMYTALQLYRDENLEHARLNFLVRALEKEADRIPAGQMREEYQILTEAKRDLELCKPEFLTEDEPSTNRPGTGTTRQRMFETFFEGRGDEFAADPGSASYRTPNTPRSVTSSAHGSPMNMSSPVCFHSEFENRLITPSSPTSTAVNPVSHRKSRNAKWNRLKSLIPIWLNDKFPGWASEPIVSTEILQFAGEKVLETPGLQDVNTDPAQLVNIIKLVKDQQHAKMKRRQEVAR